MQSSFYVGMSGQIAIDKRLQSIANNIANMNTAGYRAEGVTFDDRAVEHRRPPGGLQHRRAPTTSRAGRAS